MKRIELGCGPNKKVGYWGIDKEEFPGVDKLWDIEKWGIPAKTNSVDEIRAYDFIEHCANKISLLEEIYRVLKPNGIIDIQVPSTDGRGAFQDWTHKSYYNQNSFHPMYMSGRFVAGKYKFEILECCTTKKNKEEVCWVKVKLKAVKE